MLGLAQLGTLAIGQIPSASPDFPIYPDRWFRPLSEPKRFKPILNPGLNLFNSMPFPFIKSPSNTIYAWHKWFDNPVWPKKGMRKEYQQTLAHPPLKIAKPSVFLTLSVREINLDVWDGGLNVYDGTIPVYVLIAGANVTIKEIPSTNSGAASVTEN
jgi:hypothetical protein